MVAFIMKNRADADQRVRYVFRLEDGQEICYDLVYNTVTMTICHGRPRPRAHWILLDFLKCSHCPLSATKHPDCPAAAALSGVLGSFEGTVSYDPVFLTVETDHRTVTHATTAQRAIGSLMGLLLAVSGCPHTVFLRPMARFHLPLSDEFETLYRVASMYLLGQYFAIADGAVPDMKMTGLLALYDNLQKVNFGLADRLREATRTDSSLNAIVCLDVFTRTVPMAIESFLMEIKPLFQIPSTK
jgi:hypothetical protein